jgi:hypothetical protein
VITLLYFLFHGRRGHLPLEELNSEYAKRAYK